MKSLPIYFMALIFYGKLAKRWTKYIFIDIYFRQGCHAKYSDIEAQFRAMDGNIPKKMH